LDTKEFIINFLLQLKYIDTIYLSKTLLSDKYNEINIAQNIKNFVGFNNSKGVVMKFSPTTKKECENCWPSITEIVMNYLNNFKEGKGLNIYVKHDFIHYLEKVKLLCNLNNYETFIIDESKEEAKIIILAKINEAMKAKRLPSINEQLDSQISLLEEMVNSLALNGKYLLKIKFIIEDYSRQILKGVENNYNLKSKYENNNIIKNNEKKSKDKNEKKIRKKVKAKNY
jgi:hypothetical protein